MVGEYLSTVPNDTLGRPLKDLRISVTDRCSFRCVYCMPREIYDGHEYLNRSEVLTYDEIALVARAAAGLGVQKVRLTGGEPLLRRQLPVLVAMLSGIDGIDDLALTTNGHLLEAQVPDLVAAGLDRVTVSLDAIDEAVHLAMSDTDVPVATILSSIDAASAAGLGPIKVNTVVQRGWNDHQVLPIVERFRGTGHTPRFIEYMDVGTTNGWSEDDVVTTQDLVEVIGSRWPMEPQPRSHPGEVASTYSFTDGRGDVGFISSVSQPFCGDCSRLRLSADGSLYTCLFASKGHDVKEAIRSGATEDDIAEFIASVWSSRGDRYSELRGGVALPDPKVEMSYIGG